VDSLRNFPSSPSRRGGFDLGIIDFQRVRDHPGSGRITTPLAPPGRWSCRNSPVFPQITSRSGRSADFRTSYGRWTISILGRSLAEEHVPDRAWGRRLGGLLADQFWRGCATANRFCISVNLNPQENVDHSQGSSLAAHPPEIRRRRYSDNFVFYGFNRRPGFNDYQNGTLRIWAMPGNGRLDHSLLGF